MKAIVPVWGRHAALLGPMVANLRRHWDDVEVIVIGERPGGFPEGAEFLDAGPFTEQGYSMFLKHALSLLDDHAVYVTPVDIFLLGDVHVDKMTACLRYLEARPGVARLDFLHELLHPSVPVEEWEGLRIVRNDSIFDGMCTGPGLWNRENLTALLQPGWTIWQIEQIGTYRMRERGFAGLCVDPPLTVEADIVSNCHRILWRLDKLLPEDRAALEAALPPGWKPYA